MATDGRRVTRAPVTMESGWDGEDTSDDNPVRRRISDLGPAHVVSKVGPINANSKTIREALMVMRTRYISIWQLILLAGGMQALLYFSSPNRSYFSSVEVDTITARMFEQVHYWCAPRSTRPSV